MYTTLAVSGYRSLRDVVLPLGRVTVVTGANGAGKSNLHKALRLLSACGRGRVVGELAAEGGLTSVLWAGPESLDGARRTGRVEGTVRTGPISLRIGLGGDSLGYLIDLGIPTQMPKMRCAFDRDPEIKREAVWVGPVMRGTTTIATRKRGLARVRDDGPWQTLPQLATHDSFLDHDGLPELRRLRRELAGWRFYEALRTDATAPARFPQPGTRTVALADDGHDLAAALVTIAETGTEPLDELFSDAFPGSWLTPSVDDGKFEVAVTQPGMLRPLRAAELSDGTLRYLMLLAALTAPQLPAILALNEPERSLHPSLLKPLGHLIAHASARTQLIVVTHSTALAQAIDDATDACERIELRKDLGETVVDDQGLLSRPAWEWGSR